jgi:hypothetical protein
MKYDPRLMQIRQEVARTQLAWPGRGTRACSPPRIYELLIVFLSIQLLGLVLSPAVVAHGPDHEHLIIGGDAQMARTALSWHQHSVFEPHSHPITGSVFEPLGQDRTQVISYTSNVATELSSYFGMIVSEILAPNGGIPAVPLFLLLPLGLAAMAFTLRPALAPPAPPPKHSAG